MLQGHTVPNVKIHVTVIVKIEVFRDLKHDTESGTTDLKSLAVKNAATLASVPDP
jgi:hypothetical protein